MCGIVAVIGPNSESFPVEEAVQTLRHRGPDDFGVSRLDGAVLGHTRLSILDLSSAGHQPMELQDEELCIVHNGEIYNYIELRELLGLDRFRSKTDTEVILRSYATYGKECVRKFNGMFAFAIWNNQKKELFAARDRVGIKPFYYCVFNGHLLIASEIKALLILGYPRQPNDQVIWDYLANGHYEHGEETFFKGIRRLLPGHCLRYDHKSGIRVERYWYLPDELSDGQHVNPEERFLEILDQVMELECRSDVPLGNLLSGGLDSGALLYLLRRHSTGDLQAFSYAFEEEGYDETPYMKPLVNKFDVVHHVSRMNPDEFWEDFPETLWHMDEPSGSITLTAFKKVFESIRDEGIGVVLTGNGMDELLGGYKPAHKAYLADLLKEDSPDFQREFTYYTNRYAVSKKVLFAELSDYSLSREKMNAPVDGTLPVQKQCLNQGFLSSFESNMDVDMPFKSNLRNTLYRDLMYHKIPRSLRFQDRISMRLGKELRPPFLNHLLIEFAYSLNARHLIQRGEQKFLLRKVMKDKLPNGFVSQPKRLITHPQREWLREPLSANILDIIRSDSFRSRPYFDLNQIETKYQQWRQGEGNNSFFIWQWLNIEMWFRVFIDPPRIDSKTSK